MFNVAKTLTEKMERKGLVTRKNLGSAGGGDGEGGADGGGDSDYEIREDGVQLTEKDMVRTKTGTWATVTAAGDDSVGKPLGGNEGSS